MTVDWQPTCSLELLRLRAKLLHAIRCFFSERGVLEVETPLLSYSSITDPQLDFLSTQLYYPPHNQNLILQTSPEFAMKRLLAAGSGSIFQICKAFRNGESGRYHNPEFSLLEWYRVGYSLAQLMDEIVELIIVLFNGHQVLNETQRYSYQEIFKHHTGLDPLNFSYPDYCHYARDNQLSDGIAICGQNHNLWLDLLFSHKVQPNLGKNALCLIHDYPACQSALARIHQDNPNVCERVEIFMNGVELGNGYYELIDAVEQERRFDHEIKIRQANNQPAAFKDNRLIAALNVGLPECSGMAIGLDRLLMLLSGSARISDVLAFPVERA